LVLFHLFPNSIFVFMIPTVALSLAMPEIP
jgi:hypothetical protein